MSVVKNVEWLEKAETEEQEELHRISGVFEVN